MLFFFSRVPISWKHKVRHSATVNKAKWNQVKSNERHTKCYEKIEKAIEWKTEIKNMTVSHSAAMQSIKNQRPGEWDAHMRCQETERKRGRKNERKHWLARHKICQVSLHFSDPFVPLHPVTQTDKQIKCALLAEQKHSGAFACLSNLWCIRWYHPK